MGALFEHLGPRAQLSLTPAGGLRSGGVAFGTALLVSPAEFHAWKPSSADADREADILRFLAESGGPGEFLLYGTGPTQRFPSTDFIRQIEQRGLGLEVMDTSTALRTYNVLVSERRQFAAALLPASKG